MAISKAGKGVEEIKKDAAMEKEKQLAELKISGQNSSLATSAVSASLKHRAPQPQSTNTGSLQQPPGSRVLAQQATRDNQIKPLHNMHSFTTNKASTTTSEEFKYGFPSDGLSSISFKWWGNKSSIENGIDNKKSSTGDSVARKQQPEDSMAVGEGKENERDGVIQWASSLSALRKRAAEDGQRALKLGVSRDYNVKTLDGTKKAPLLQIFRSSLPSEWGEMSSES